MYDSFRIHCFSGVRIRQVRVLGHGCSYFPSAARRKDSDVPGFTEGQHMVLTEEKLRKLRIFAKWKEQTCKIMRLIYVQVPWECSAVIHEWIWGNISYLHWYFTALCSLSLYFCVFSCKLYIFFEPFACPHLRGISITIISSWKGAIVICLPFLFQELIKNKARSGQSCYLLEDAFSAVSCLPWRSDNLHQVSLIENYPAPLTALGEPVRQVSEDDFHAVTVKFRLRFLNYIISPYLFIFYFPI